MDFLAQIKRINQTILASRSFAGYYRAHQRTRAAGFQIVLFQICNQRLDIFISNPLYFHCQTGSHGNFPASETLCTLRNRTVFFRCDFPIPRYDTDIKNIIITFILQTS